VQNSVGSAHFLLHFAALLSQLQESGLLDKLFKIATKHDF